MYIKLNDIIINYQEYGAGIPVLAIHGYGVDHHLMEGCLEPIFENRNNEYRRIYIDLPNMGKSKAFNDSIKNADDMIEALLEFIHRIIGVQHFLLIGESYGGYLSLGILGRAEDKILGLSLICPCIEPNQEKRILPEHKQITIENDFLREEDPEIVESYLEMAVIISQKTFKRFKEEIYPSFERGNKAFLRDYQKKGYAYSKMLYSSYQLPCVFLAGKQDQIVGYQDLYDKLSFFPNASMYLLDNAGHNLQIEQEEIFQCAMEEWLERVPSIPKIS